jgi:hypothetical protein
MSPTVTDRFAGFDQEKLSFRTHGYSFEASYGDAESTTQLEIPDVECSGGFKSTFK